MSKLSNYKFYNIPREYDLRSYKESIDYLLKRYSKIKNLMSIYEWGSIGAPGISDIDLIFIFRSTSSKGLPLFKRSFYFLNKKVRYLVRHPFIFIDEKTFHNVKYIYQKTNFKLLYGRDIKIKNINAKEKYYANIALLNDLIIRHYPRDFIGQSINGTINVRDTLLRLNSLGYTIKILKNLTKGGCNSWNQTVYRIKNLRKDWFKLKDFNEVALLNDEAVSISMSIIDTFRKFLLKNKIVKINSGEKITYNGIKNKSLFRKRWNKQEASKEMINSIKNRKRLYSILPLELAPQLIEYSKSGGLISNYVKKNISNRITYNMKYNEIINKRIEILNNQAKLALKLKHSDFTAFFDFGYRNKSGINNWALNMIDKVRF